MSIISVVTWVLFIVYLSRLQDLRGTDQRTATKPDEIMTQFHESNLE